MARPMPPVAPVMRTSLWLRVSVVTDRDEERSGMTLAAEERLDVGPMVDVRRGFWEIVDERSDISDQ